MKSTAKAVLQESWLNAKKEAIITIKAMHFVINVNGYH